MKIRFYAHASFRLEADGLVVVTDPYNPARSGFAPIDEPADLVIMSSATDEFHSDPSHVRGAPEVVNALALPPGGGTAKGVAIRSFPAYESLTFDFRAAAGRDPDANALYHFTLGGLRVLHMGDIGNPVAPGHLAALRGQVDILFALTGEHATIALDDLDRAIAAIGPRVVIPMHYFSPRGVLKIEPVERFLARCPPASVTRVGGPELELTPETLPARLRHPRRRAGAGADAGDAAGRFATRLRAGAVPVGRRVREALSLDRAGPRHPPPAPCPPPPRAR